MWVRSGQSLSYTLNTGAYQAEVIRGGLAAIPRGQVEAASALGLSWWRTTSLIVLPQALRHVIPALVNSFISLFKDTSLVSIVALFDLLGQLHRDRPFIVHFESDFHTVGEEGRSFADEIGRESDLFVILLVHEDEAVAIDKQELEVLGVEPDTFDRVLAAETHIGLASVDQVLHFDLHERPALAGLGVLGLGDFPDAFLVFENIARTNVDAADLHGRCLL